MPEDVGIPLVEHESNPDGYYALEIHVSANKKNTCLKILPVKNEIYSLKIKPKRARK